MSYIQNKYFVIPEDVWWYEQCWTYDNKCKFKTDGVYIQIHSVFFDYSTWYSTVFIPFTIEKHVIKLTQHRTYYKEKHVIKLT